MIAGIVYPGYNSPSSWNGSPCTGYPATAAALGFNWGVLMTEYSSANWLATDVTSTATGSASGALADAAITAMVQAMRAAGQRIMLKPHCVMADGTTQSLHLPGANFSKATGSNSNPNDGTYTSGQTSLSSTHFTLTSANTGDRVVSPSVGHLSEMPNSGYADAYARGSAPIFTTITYVSATSATLSAPAGASSSTGFVAILHDATAATWFTNWQTTLLHILSVAKAADPLGIGADAINIGTEFDWKYRYYPSNWRTIISAIRSAYPGILVTAQTSEGLTYGGDIPFADALDYIGVSCYPTVGANSGGSSGGAATDTPAAVYNGFVQNMVLPLKAYSAAWGKPVLAAELGARSIVNACYQPYNFAGGTSQRPATDQGQFVEGALASCIGQPWFAGFCWWNWYGPTGSESTSYAPQAAAETAFSTYLPGQAPIAQRLFDSGTAHLRRTH